MSRYLFLDSGPLGLLTNPQRNPEVVAITEWLDHCLLEGSNVVVPAIIYYEMKRELLRARKRAGIDRLDAFIRVHGSYLELSDRALQLAAELWAKSRQEGQPTAGPGMLDIDVILVAQVLTFGFSSSSVIVTTNRKHISRFVTAKAWSEIAPSQVQ